MSRAERSDPRLYVDRAIEEACSSGSLSSALAVADAVGDLTIELFLHSKAVRYGVAVGAPTEGRQNTRVTWLARQFRRLPDIPDDLQVTVVWSKRGLTSAGPAPAFAKDPSILLHDPQGVPIAKDIMPRRFVLQRTGALHTARGRSTSRVLAGITTGLEDFYRRVVEGLVPYVPPAPRLPKEKEPEPEAPSAVEN
jgi:hypothetical protein